MKYKFLPRDFRFISNCSLFRTSLIDFSVLFRRAVHNQLQSVPLAYSVYDPKSPGSPKTQKNGRLKGKGVWHCEPIVIIHGLFGHRGNWNSVAKRLSLELDRCVIMYLIILGIMNLIMTVYFAWDSNNHFQLYYRFLQHVCMFLNII